jgi:hypothetical protein
MLPGYSIKIPTPPPTPIDPINPVEPVTPSKLPPFGYAGSALFNYVNKSGKPDNQVMIQVIGTNPLTNAQCFIKYHPDGTFDYVDVPLGKNKTSADFANRLSDFPKHGEGRAIYLPVGGGMRLYTSLGDKPVHMETGTLPNGTPCITHPDPHVKNHPGLDDMPWDKVEFNIDWGTLLQKANPVGNKMSMADLNNLLKVSKIPKIATNDFNNLGVVFINPTAVDGFALPLYVDALRKGGKLTQPGGNIKQQGGITSSPAKVFSDFNENIKNIPSTGDAKMDGYIRAEWKRLFIGEGENRRLLSPMDAAPTGHFATDFFEKTGWLDKFKSVYSSGSMKIDMNESGGMGIWDMTYNKATNQLIFTNPKDPKNPIKMILPTDTQSLLSGTGKAWGFSNPPAIGTPEDPKIGLQRALIRNLSVAIDTNTLTTQPFPLKDATGKLVKDSNGNSIDGVGIEYFKYMETQGRLCAPNPEMGTRGPQFINVYSNAIHGNAPDGQVYAGAYSDEEGRPGAGAQRMGDFESGHIILGPMT